MSALPPRRAPSPPSAAEVQMLEALTPAELTWDMREVALCLFQVLAMRDTRCGSKAPGVAWRAELAALAALALAQVDHLAREIGGRSVYLAKGVAMRLSARDVELCGRFTGNNYAQLASQYDLTEMRVRQIVGAWQQERYRTLQGRLPGLDDEDGA